MIKSQEEYNIRILEEDSEKYLANTNLKYQQKFIPVFNNIKLSEQQKCVG